MCDQTEISYSDGDIVWVKFHNLWWPGEVYGASRLPPGLIESFRRLPVAVVKFFQENAYEYVKTINEIYRYNCTRKNEFIKKGMDIFRAKKRANMEKFPEDVGIAESKTGGDPKIINKPEFQPEQKPDIARIFGDQTPKIKKGKGGRRKASPEEDSSAYSRANKTTSKTTPKSDYYLPPSRSYSAQNKTPTTSIGQSGADYKCQHCNFSTNRINVLLFHNKMHSSEKKNVPETKIVGKPLTPPPRKLQTKKTKMRSRAIFAGFDETDSDEDEFENNRGIVLGDSSETSPRSGRRSFVRAPPKKRQPRKLSTAIVSQEKTPSVEKTIPVVVKPKDAAKQVQIKRSILADWGDDDEDGGVDDDDDFDKMDDESKEIQLSEEPKEDTSSLELTEITVQDKSEDSPKKPIRNIPKKDRCRNMNNLDEFYKNQVPSSSASNATDSAVIVLDSEDDSDDNVRKMFDDDSDKEREELGQSSDDQVEEVIDEIDEIDEINIGVKKTDDEQELQILETGIPISLKSEMAENTKTVDNQSQQETNNETRSDENDIQEKTEDQTRLHMDKAGNDETTENKNELDSLLLQHSAELLEETSQLTANIETVGVIEKKKRLQRKHKITESEESVPSLSTADEDQAIQINSEDSQIKEAVEQSDIIENGESNCSAENKNDEEKSTEQLENNIENSLIEENNSIEEKIEQIIQETNTEDEVTEKEVHENMIIVELLEAETSSIQNSEIIDEITTEDVTENKENENQIVIESSEMIQEETVKLQKLKKKNSLFAMALA